MLLKRRDVKKSRKQYECDWCYSFIPVGTPYTYLYGAAEIGEKPYALRYCPYCQAEQDKMNADVKAAKDATD